MAPTPVDTLISQVAEHFGPKSVITDAADILFAP